MPFLNNKELNKIKSTQENIDANLKNVQQQIQLLSHDWESIAETNRKASILSSNIAQAIAGGNTDIEKKDRYNGSTYNQIQRNELPSYMSWDYWVLVNSWADYWVNRYGQFDHDNRENILKAIRLACLYGSGAIVKATGQAIVCFTTDGVKYTGYSSYEGLNSTFASVEKRSLKVSDKAKKTTYTREELFIFTWRFNDIGDFVWCMKDLLTDIFIKKIIECNTSQLVNKTYYRCKNAETIATELIVNNDPFINYGVIISDEGAKDLGKANDIIETKIANDNSHINALIEAHKHHMEYYYNKYGRVITSAKQQSLSSDANLTVSSAELIADEHDRRIETTLKEMGITIEINEIDPNEQPQNDNADKDGEGIANTNGDNSKEKAENQ